MRALPAGLALVAAGVMLAGCAAAIEPIASSPAASVPSPTAEVADQDPLGLFGDWSIIEAMGEEPGTVVRIGATELEIWRPCGDVLGSWVADGAQLRAVASGYSQTCNPLPPVTWLDDAASYELAGERLTLRSDDGRVLAVLVAEAAVLPAGRVPLQQFSTAIDDRARDHFAGVMSWPAGLEPADAADLLGRWVPRGEYTTDPHVVFSESGRWSGTDGCNGGGGRWILSSDGSFDSTSGAMFLRGCNGAQVPTWIMMARGAGMDGDELVMLDLEGDELGRLERP
ncbi:hypothetical protein QL996_09875 [Planococcus sp. APC 4015]|nr:hypothetical protein [Planococcus sp. APC 4015]